jgi:hypothetical protein
MSRTLPKAVPVDAFGQWSARNLAEPGRQPIDAGEGRKRIVHGRGKGADGDLDELIDGKYRILHEGPMGTAHVCFGECQCDLSPRTSGPDGGQWLSCAMKWPGR